MGYKNLKNKTKKYKKHKSAKHKRHTKIDSSRRLMVRKREKTTKKNKTGGIPKKRNQKKGTRNKTVGYKLHHFKSSTCSPDQELDFTCYNNNELERIKKNWNISNPNKQILTNDTKDIWTNLKTNLVDKCDTEKCWLKQQFMKAALDDNLLKHTFAPMAPAKWRGNPNEWLDSNNIIQVMKQYEHTYPDFKFIGPSPIDFDAKESFSRCVWPELCNFNLADYQRDNITKKTKIGMIFNTDPHTKGGSHWISAFLNLKEKYLYYFDSNADATPKEVILLFHDIKYQALALTPPIILNILKNGVEHQHTDTECGVYSLYTIVTLLTGENKLKDFDKRIPDSVMERYRNIFFTKQ